MRKRFNAAERDLIAQAGDGRLVEWQNVTRWHPGRLTGGITRDESGWEWVPVINLATTARLSAGAQIRVGPGHIRARP